MLTGILIYSVHSIGVIKYKSLMSIHVCWVSFVDNTLFYSNFTLIKSTIVVSVGLFFFQIATDY